MKKNLLILACAFMLGVGMVSGTAVTATGQNTEEKKSPNDQTVRNLMSWAFAAIPETETRDGKEVKLDRTNPKNFLIPVDDARRVIRAAMRSANANLCGLSKLEAQNFGKMMKVEKAFGKWTRDQILFIKHLHIATGLVMTGDFTAGKEAEKVPAGESDKGPEFKRRTYDCSPKEQERVKQTIEAYLKE